MLIELANNVVEPLNLPEWTPRLIILLALIGFPVVAILSWIFDITPKGIKKTVQYEPEPDEISQARESRRKLKASDVIISILFIVICILLYPKIFMKDRFKEIRDENKRISVAVMPFKNLTSDTIFNIWQQGLQNLLITSLSNTEGLSIRQAQTINDIISGEDLVSYASLEPSFAKDVAVRIKANTVILGNIHKSGNQFRITANLINSKTDETYKSFQVDGNTENDFFVLVDSLATQIRNFLEIELLEKRLPLELKNAFTSSADAYKYYLQGRNYHARLEYSTANGLYLKALQIDTGFVLPMLYLAYSYGDLGQSDQSKKWAYEAYYHLNKVPIEIQLHIKEVKAMVDKRPYEQIKYITEYLEIYPYSTQQYYSLGWVCNNTEQWQKSIDALESGRELNEQLGNKIRFWAYFYTILGDSYSKIGDYKKATEVFEDGLTVLPDDPIILYWQSVCAIKYADSVIADKCHLRLSNIADEKGWPESRKLLWIASSYDQGGNLSKAEKLYRNALHLYPDNIELKYRLGSLLITNDLDVDQGIELITPLLEGYPDSCDYLYTYGLSLYKKGEFDKASEVLNKAWNLRPYYWHEHYLLLQEVNQALAV